jgi:acid phosphatase type 7
MRPLLLCFTFFTSLLSAQIPAMVYGPYIQQTGQTSAIFNWRTDISCDSRVKVGLTKTNLSLVNINTNAVIHHSISISGLSANTKYFYNVSNSGGTFVSDTFFFYTAPPASTTQKIRVIATGDCGTGLSTQINVRNALMNFIKNSYINCWLILGDNAYENGLDNEYTDLFFTPYQSNFIMHHTCLYPCIGNHDYANTSTLQESKAVPYYDLFNLPTAGQLGGVASNSEAYYSYNYGNIHFVSVDSYGTETSLRVYDTTASPQYQWLKQDLKANNSMWTIVYFHHPPYTMGNHNSDSEAELLFIRTYLTPLFEQNKVDLVLNGHSHNYERSWLIKGHTGLESSFSKPLHGKDTSSAKYDGTANSCPYIKDTVSNKGVVYTVCGSSGKVTTIQPSFPHNAMYYSNASTGIGAYLEVEGNRLSAFFIGEDSLVKDKFTIFKNIRKDRSITVVSNQVYTVSASWPGNYAWSHNTLTSKQNTFAVGSNTFIYVRDSLNCFADTFRLNVISGLEEYKSDRLNIFPNPVYDQVINLDLDESVKITEVTLQDVSGRKYRVEKFETVKNEIKLFLPNLANGVYLVRLNTSRGLVTRKIILSDK